MVWGYDTAQQFPQYSPPLITPKPKSTPTPINQQNALTIIRTKTRNDRDDQQSTPSAHSTHLRFFLFLLLIAHKEVIMCFELPTPNIS